MVNKSHFTLAEAKQIGESLDIRWKTFDAEQFQLGMNMELEHGLFDPSTNVTNDDPILIAKLAWAHLKMFADYYDRLQEMEAQAVFFWKRNPKRSRVNFEKTSSPKYSEQNNANVA